MCICKRLPFQQKEPYITKMIKTLSAEIFEWVNRRIPKVFKICVCQISPYKLFAIVLLQAP